MVILVGLTVDSRSVVVLMIEQVINTQIDNTIHTFSLVIQSNMQYMSIAVQGFCSTGIKACTKL